MQVTWVTHRVAHLVRIGYARRIMFTGIVDGPYRVGFVKCQPGLTHYSIVLPLEKQQNLQIGASVSVDGVCQTVVSIDQDHVFFDAIQETLDRTTLSDIQVGREVNIERAARFGDEVGGHFVSGHIYCKVRIEVIQRSAEQYILGLRCPTEIMQFLFQKGYVALDGASLTIVDVDLTGYFTVHLIPETLRKTGLGKKKIGDWVNLELDSQTQAIVETVHRYLERNGATK